MVNKLISKSVLLSLKVWNVREVEIDGKYKTVKLSNLLINRPTADILKNMTNCLEQSNYLYSCI